MGRMLATTALAVGCLLIVGCAASGDAADRGLTEGNVWFNSKLPLEVLVCDGHGGIWTLGRTPAAEPLPIPKCRWWAVVPLKGVSLADVAAEGKVKGVRGLKLRDASNGDLAQLSGWVELQTLDLSLSNITDGGLVHLKGLKGLRTLILSNTKITDAGLAHLRELKGLRTLDLKLTDITSGGLAELRTALPNTTIHY